MKKAEAKRKGEYMSVISMKALLESGVHFGHRTHKWNPRMKPYIFTERNGIHIINLQQTVKSIEEAYDVIRDTVAAGGTVLFVGTKRQAQETVQEEAIRCGMPHVTARWLGGMLTNWRTIRDRINELDRLERMRDRGDFERITKKEGLILSREIEKLDTRLGGIRKIVKLPDLLFVVDVRREETAIHEANLLNIPIVAMVDTNCDPTNVDYVIPSNDDAIRAIKLVVSKIADAVLEGRGLRKDDGLDQEVALAAAIKVDETELADEDLLGAATLAKLQRVVNLSDVLDDAADDEDYSTFDFEEDIVEDELMDEAIIEDLAEEFDDEDEYEDE
jgi:small subunit ribosomal protein S2